MGGVSNCRGDVLTPTPRGQLGCLRVGAGEKSSNRWRVFSRIRSCEKRRGLLRRRDQLFGAMTVGKLNIRDLILVLEEDWNRGPSNIAGLDESPSWSRVYKSLLARTSEMAIDEPIKLGSLFAPLVVCWLCGGRANERECLSGL